MTSKQKISPLQQDFYFEIIFKVIQRIKTDLRFSLNFFVSNLLVKLKIIRLLLFEDTHYVRH